MFNIALGIFLLISPILFLPLSVPAVATLQWYQFGFFTNDIEVVQRQIFLYGIVFLSIFSMGCSQKRKLDDIFIQLLMTTDSLIRATKNILKNSSAGSVRRGFMAHGNLWRARSFPISILTYIFIRMSRHN